MIAKDVGGMLKGCEWVGVPFAGGMSELPFIDARTIVVNDLHRHVINLASVIARGQLKETMARTLAMIPFHPDALAQAHERNIARDQNDQPWDGKPDVNWATDYFVSSWMSRAGASGATGEFNAGLSVRWNAAGGDSVKRYQNAVNSLEDWSRLMQRCTFTCMDVFDFLEKCKDQEGHGIYCDPPFPGPGDKYKHGPKGPRENFEFHSRLAEALGSYSQTRIVCRYYDNPLVRDLYPPTTWAWCEAGGRKQTNELGDDVLLLLSGRGAPVSLDANS